MREEDCFVIREGETLKEFIKELGAGTRIFTDLGVMYIDEDRLVIVRKPLIVKDE